jgi:hypothetical protein
LFPFSVPWAALADDKTLYLKDPMVVGEANQEFYHSYVVAVVMGEMSQVWLFVVEYLSGFLM